MEVNGLDLPNSLKIGGDGSVDGTTTTTKLLVASSGQQSILEQQQASPTSGVNHPPPLLDLRLPTLTGRTELRSPASLLLSEVKQRIQLDHNYALQTPPPPNSKFVSPRPNNIHYVLDGNPDAGSNSNSKSPLHPYGTTNNNNNCKTSAKSSTTSKLEYLLKKGLSKSSSGRNGSCGSFPPINGLPNPKNKCLVSKTSSIIPAPPPNKLPHYDTLEDVDVVTPVPSPHLRYDSAKAFNLMNECEKNVNFARNTDVAEDWEKQIVKTGWTRVQRSLFKHTMQALHAENLARLAYNGGCAEPVLRRTNLDLTAQRVRQILTGVLWDAKLTQWLHGVLVDNLSLSYLGSYLDVLQTLRAKAPSLVDRMMLLSTAAAASATSSSPSSEHLVSPILIPPSPQESDSMKKIVNAEALNLLVKRQWDPFSPVVHQHRGKKLIQNPVLVMVPCGPSWANPVGSRRYKSFISLLSVLGKVVSVSTSQISATNITVDEFTERMIRLSEQKLIETKNTFKDRPIYLIGWGPGAGIAATIAVNHEVAGVICLGFPMFGVSGQKGEDGDPLLNVKSPVLFIIGERTPNNSVSHMDKFRRHLKCESTLVVIRTGDDYLRVRRYHRKLLLVTQSYVDKSIVDEVALFITSQLAEPSPNPNGSSGMPVSNAGPLPDSSSSTIPRVLKRSWSDSPNRKANNKARMDVDLSLDGSEFTFDDTKKVPSSASSSRRKSNYKPASPRPSSCSSPYDYDLSTPSSYQVPVITNSEGMSNNILGTSPLASTSAFTTASSVFHSKLKRGWSELGPSDSTPKKKKVANSRQPVVELNGGAEFNFEDTKKVSTSPSSSRRKANYLPASPSSSSSVLVVPSIPSPTPNTTPDSSNERTAVLDESKLSPLTPVQVQTITSFPLSKLGLSGDRNFSSLPQVVQVLKASDLKDYVINGGDLKQLLVGSVGHDQLTPPSSRPLIPPESSSLIPGESLINCKNKKQRIGCHPLIRR